jgi:hypothetical protein
LISWASTLAPPPVRSAAQCIRNMHSATSGDDSPVATSGQPPDRVSRRRQHLSAIPSPAVGQVPVRG